LRDIKLPCKERSRSVN